MIYKRKSNNIIMHVKIDPDLILDYTRIEPDLGADMHGLAMKAYPEWPPGISISFIATYLASNDKAAGGIRSYGDCPSQRLHALKDAERRRASRIHMDRPDLTDGQVWDAMQCELARDIRPVIDDFFGYVPQLQELADLAEKQKTLRMRQMELLGV